VEPFIIDSRLFHSLVHHKISEVILVRSINSKLAVGIAFGLFSSAALADVVGPIPRPNTGDGGVFVAVWTETKSTVQYLGKKFSEFQPAAVADAGMLMFDVDLGVFSGDLTGARYMVIAGDYNGDVAVGNGLLFTHQGTNSVPQSGMVNAASATDSFVRSINIQCNLSVPCTSTSSADTWFANNLFEAISGNIGAVAASIGGALAFYSASGVDDLSVDDPAELVRYGNVFGNTIVTLDGTKLKFETPTVPLPAAAWLLLSGLLGLGAVGRRRAVSA
jgi:hypothetical protein